MPTRKNLFICAGVLALVAGCAAQTEEPVPIYPEPTYDKYGNPECRPAHIPIGGIYAAELPVCEIPEDACDPGGIYSTNPDICPPPPQREGGEGGEPTGARN